MENEQFPIANYQLKNMNTKAILKYGLIYGSLTALSCMLFFVVMYYLNGNPLLFRRPDIGFNIIFIGFAIWNFRRHNGGFLHFYEGFSIGFLTNIIGAILTGLFIYLFIVFIDNQPLLNWIESSKQILIKQKATFAAILNEQNFQSQYKAISEAKPYQIILDELMFKQFGIIAITLWTMILRKLE